MPIFRYTGLLVVVLGLAVLGYAGAPGGAASKSQQGLYFVRVPQDFPTIQAAVDAVAEGGTVLIGPGTYQENIRINKSIRLVGSYQGSVRIQPKEDTTSLQLPPEIRAIDIQGRQVYLENFTVEHSLPNVATGIYLAAYQAIVHQVTISGFVSRGLFIAGGDTLLARITIRNSGIGVEDWAFGGTLSIFESVFHDNGDAIKSIGSERLRVQQSMFIRNSSAAVVIAQLPPTGGKQIELLANAITGNSVGLYIASLQSRGKEPNEPEPVPYLINMRDNEIISNTEYGIALGGSGCLDDLEESLMLYPFSLADNIQKPQIVFWEENNKIHNNLKADLCPADYPWPPGFRK